MRTMYFAVRPHMERLDQIRPSQWTSPVLAARVDRQMVSTLGTPECVGQLALGGGRTDGWSKGSDVSLGGSGSRFSAASELGVGDFSQLFERVTRGAFPKHASRSGAAQVSDVWRRWQDG